MNNVTHDRKSPGGVDKGPERHDSLGRTGASDDRPVEGATMSTRGTDDGPEDERGGSAAAPGGEKADDGSSSTAATVGERLTGERDPRDPDGLLTVDQIAGGSHGASPEEGLRVPRDGRIEEPTAEETETDR
jgi:hypothetical protein